jgi:hypothetical protein
LLSATRQENSQSVVASLDSEPTCSFFFEKSRKATIFGLFIIVMHCKFIKCLWSYTFLALALALAHTVEQHTEHASPGFFSHPVVDLKNGHEMQDLAEEKLPLLLLFYTESEAVRTLITEFYAFSCDYEFVWLY